MRVCMRSSFKSCLALRDLMNYSLSGSSVHGILQARILEWVAMSFPGDLPNPGIEPDFLVSSASRFFTTRATWKAQICV